MNTITRNNLIAGFLFPRQWRNWYFVGIGWVVLFIVSLSPNAELAGTSEPIIVNDAGVHIFGDRITMFSYIVLACLVWHFTVGTWRARLTTARQRREGYRPGEAPVASQLATRAIQATTRVVQATPAPEAPVQRAEAPVAPYVAPTAVVPQLILPASFGTTRKVQWAEDHGSFTVVDRRRFADES